MKLCSGSKRELVRLQVRNRGYGIGEEYPDVAERLVDGDTPDHIRDSFVSQKTEVEQLEIDGSLQDAVITYDSKEIQNGDLYHLIGATRAIYTEEELNPILRGILHGDRNHITLDKGILVLVPWVSIVLTGLLRGSSGLREHIGVESCNFMDFFLLVLTAMILIFFAVVGILLLMRDYTYRKKFGYKFVRGDLQWNNQTIVAFASLAFIGGFIGGLVGLSTEVLFTPFYIRFGAAPSVARATSQFLGIFLSIIAMSVFAFDGYVFWGHAVWLGGFAIIATLVGH